MNESFTDKHTQADRNRALKNAGVNLSSIVKEIVSVLLSTPTVIAGIAALYKSAETIYSSSSTSQIMHELFKIPMNQWNELAVSFNTAMATGSMSSWASCGDMIDQILQPMVKKIPLDRN